MKSDLKTALAWLAPKLLLAACWVVWVMLVTAFASLRYTNCESSPIWGTATYWFAVFALPLLLLLPRLGAWVKKHTYGSFGWEDQLRIALVLLWLILTVIVALFYIDFFAL